MLKSSLCDYSNAYIHVKGTIYQSEIPQPPCSCKE